MSKTRFELTVIVRDATGISHTRYNLFLEINDLICPNRDDPVSLVNGICTRVTTVMYNPDSERHLVTVRLAPVSGDDPEDDARLLSILLSKGWKEQ